MSLTILHYRFINQRLVLRVLPYSLWLLSIPLLESFWIKTALFSTSHERISLIRVQWLNSLAVTTGRLLILLTEKPWITSKPGDFQFGIFCICFLTSVSVMTMFLWFQNSVVLYCTSFNYFACCYTAMMGPTNYSKIHEMHSHLVPPIPAFSFSFQLSCLQFLCIMASHYFWASLISRESFISVLPLPSWRH